jgi:hypothetical protein
MNQRLHAAAVIARRQALEILLAPGVYITLALGMLLGFFLVKGFASSVDSAGFNPALNPLDDLLGRLITGAFGSAFLAKLFAEGPFTFALLISFLPVFLFLAINSVFRFGLEKNAGAVELLAYGPADGTSYFIASFLVNAIFTAGSLLVIAGFLCIVSIGSNLALGTLFFFSLLLLAFTSFSVFAYGILCSILSSNASAALASFLGILILFLLLLGASLSIMSASLQTATTVMAAILQWVSPFYYASLCVRAVQEGSVAGMLGGVGLLLALAVLLLVASHFVISHRGVRA